MICDGIGGLSEGEMASGYTAEKITEWFYETGLAMLRRRNGRKRVLRSILRMFSGMQEEMAEYARRKGIQLGSGVTLLLLWGNRYLIFHLGDGRAYLCRRKIRQLTCDHSDGRGVLSKCLSSLFWQKPDILQGRIGRKSGFLLCTDGFRHHVNRRQLEEAFRPGEIKEERQIRRRLREIGEYSRKKGEKDDISAIYIRIG